jgi:tetratricopeptide (TPR) repeat protein
MTLGILYHRTGRPDQAIAAYTEALTISEQIGDHELTARILQNLSITRKSFSELDEAERLLDLAMLEYQDAGRENLPGQLYSGKANIEMARGDFTQAEVYLDQALKAFDEIGDRRSEAMMLNNMGYLKWQQGKLEEAEEQISKSLAIRQEIGDHVGVGRNYTMLSGVYSATGDHERAVEAANSALGIARESNDRLFVATSLAQLAEGETAMGDLAAARQHYLEGREIFETINDQLRILQTDVKIARLDLLANRIDEAHRLTTKVLDKARQQELLEPEVEAMELTGDIQLARGDSEAATGEFAAALERVRETSWTGMETILQSKLANAYMDQHDLAAAAPLAGALAVKEQDVQVLLTRARFEHLRGNRDSAVDLMNEARSLAGVNWTQDQESLLRRYAANATP